MDPDIKLMHLESAAVRLSQLADLPIVSRRDLLDSFSFLALPGTNFPKATTDLQKARDLYYQAIRQVADGDAKDKASVDMVEALYLVPKASGFIADVINGVGEVPCRVAK